MSELMSIFNETYREIEGLVNKVKSDESTRISTLQELTHDLRTPIAKKPFGNIQVSRAPVDK